MSRVDPWRNYRYRIEIDSIQQAGFSEFTNSKPEVDVVEYREGVDPPSPRKLSGMAKYSNITLKWGITNSMDLYKWFKQVINGDVLGARKNISIIMLDEAGNDSARWDCTSCWPSKYEAPDGNASGNEVAIESLEIVCEEVIRTQ